VSASVYARSKTISIGGLMSEFIPSGYVSIREALHRLGRELFPSEWTGDETQGAPRINQ
jgi:hypothetical protein